MIQTYSTRLRIYKFAYSQGTNVALYNIERSKRYKKFQESVEKALLSQIKFVVKNKQNFDTLLMLTKAATPSQPLLDQVGVLIAKKTLSNEIDLAAYLVWVGDYGGQAALDKLGIQGVFGLKNQKVIQYFQNYANLRIDTVDETTKKWLAEKIQEGKDKLLTPFEIQNSIIDDGKAISAIRAERIVLTETAKALSTIEIEAASRYGIKIKRWKTSRDERVCPICSPLQGKEAPIKGNFEGGYSGPPAHVSCRCYLEEVIPDGWTIPSRVWLGE